MMDDDLLIAERDKLKTKMEHYRSLAGVLLDTVGILVYRVTRRRSSRGGEHEDGTHREVPHDPQHRDTPSHWYSGIVLALVTILIGLLTSKVLKELLSTREVFFTM